MIEVLVLGSFIMRALYSGIIPRALIGSNYIGRSQLFNNRSNTVESGRGNGLHKHNWIGGSCNGWDLTFSPITEGFKDQIYQRHLSWNDFNIFGSIFLWLVYGILLKNSPIIIANFFGFIQALIILLFKIKYK